MKGSTHIREKGPVTYCANPSQCQTSKQSRLVTLLVKLENRVCDKAGASTNLNLLSGA